ncbi:class F sortase [Paenibacillus sp. MCAF9]|uniref:class F sortase n=2 Tax=unclassified Paenibacillus TaxID=185978 RepID=UPI003F97BB56
MKKFILQMIAAAILAGCTACSYSNDQDHDIKAQLTKTKSEYNEPIVKAETLTSPPPSNHNPIISKTISKVKLEGIVPAKLSIPALEIDAIIDPVSITENGQMDVPSSTKRVGLLSNGILPGMVGNSVIDGHVDSHTGPAVFYRLKNIKLGDLISIRSKEDCTIDFIVESIEIFKTSEAPLSKIFGPADESRLNLITCTGKFNRKNQEYLERLVVFAKRHSDKKICKTASS